MKKLLSFFMCLALVTSLVSCGKNEQAHLSEDNSVLTTVQKEETSDTATETKETEAVEKSIFDPENGAVLKINLSVKGEIKENAPDMHANQFLLNGVAVEMPIAISSFYDLGWSIPESHYVQIKDELLEPERTTSLISYYLTDTVGNKIELIRVVNEADTEATIDACAVSEFIMHTSYYQEEWFDGLILPGGISLKSTAADIIAVFGEPENNPYFNKVSVSESGISYKDHKDNGLSYHFSFYDSEDGSGELDGKIYALRIEKDY